MRAGRFAVAAVLLFGPCLAWAAQPCSAWQDSFNAGQLDTTRWLVANGPAPGSITNQHSGVYESGNVSLNTGMLVLTLTQVNGQVGTNPSGTLSYGAMVYSQAKCGYGTYEWTMRMSSTATCPDLCTGQAVSGSVSAGFVYVNNSQTEIDFEFTGDDPTKLWMVNWLNPKPSRDPKPSNGTSSALSPFAAADGFHTYKFVWTRSKISYYVDGLWIADHTTNVPSAAAYFMINHWGADSVYWGGRATAGVTRYMYVTHASYSPSVNSTAATRTAEQP